MRRFRSLKCAVAQILSMSASAALLSACGGSDSSPGASAPAATTSQSLSMTLVAPPQDAQPTYHLAPVLLPEPDDADQTAPATSAALVPHHAAVRADLAQLSTRRLTHQVMEQLLDTGSVPPSALAAGTETDPMASSAGVTVYTPAQIRAAYGLPALPTGSSVTSAQAAQLGAGQTIYLIDAYDDPNAAAELAAFNGKFGLPTCASAPISVATVLPLANAAGGGCVFSVAYITGNGAVTPTAPAYNSGWATEIALDVQWAHATAPYARIVLIEAPDPSVASLTAAVHLANSMGPGVVSMSFGSAEGTYTSAYDSFFGAANMTYFGATGDAGAEVQWPAVSTHVVAVSGTSLTYPGTGPRSETVWSGTGGGISAYVAAPAYQGLAVPGLNKPARREVSDVAFNADPYTGQYIAVLSPGSASVSWLSAGGTSLATPQWAAIVAVANALRAQSAKGAIGPAQSLLYGLAAQSASYASNFLDVTKGSDGSCSTCTASAGYDLPSGLGTPNVASLLPSLSGAQIASAPVVSAATVTGKTGSALSFAISATDAHPLAYSLSSAPAGMLVNPSTGIVTWSAPVLGSYSVIAQASDAQTGLSAQATIGITISAPLPPQVTGATISGTAQTALSFTAQVTDANKLTYSLTGAPSGMSVSTAGVVSWSVPVAGTYTFTLTAHDATTGLSGQAAYTVVIAPIKPPSVAATSVTGTAGTALSYSANVPWSNPLSFSLSGAPAGMTIASGTGVISWASPKLGTYTVTVAAKDTKTGLTGTGLYTVTINVAGPVIQSATLGGVAGKTFSGSVSITDSVSNWLSITISGVPSGMTVAPSAGSLTFQWSSPVTGNYALHLTVVDGKNLTSAATIPLTITAH